MYDFEITKASMIMKTCHVFKSGIYKSPMTIVAKHEVLNIFEKFRKHNVTSEAILKAQGFLKVNFLRLLNKNRVFWKNLIFLFLSFSHYFMNCFTISSMWSKRTHNNNTPQTFDRIWKNTFREIAVLKFSFLLEYHFICMEKFFPPETPI